MLDLWHQALTGADVLRPLGQDGARASFPE